jgi:hypothetical protein
MLAGRMTDQIPLWEEPKRPPPWVCVDCRADTRILNEYYMVHDHVWPIGKFDGMLCIGCIEKRIGRQLVPEDFKTPMDYEAGSERLRSRWRPRTGSTW